MKLTWLTWHDKGGYTEASVGDFAGGLGARFTLQEFPTCHRRGTWRLLIEVTNSWGCFDDQDQPQRWYHKAENAWSEASAIAEALIKDNRWGS
jgi:hypothetical protein